MNIMFKILLSVISGICLGLYYKNIALFIFVFIILISFKNKNNLIFVVIALIVFLVTFNIDKKYETSFENKEICYGIGEIISFAEEKNYTNKYIINLKGKKFITYLSKEEFLEYGDTIYFKGNYKRASGQRNDKGFNYERYLRQSKIYGILNIDEFKIIKQNKGIKYYFFLGKEKLKNRLYEIFDKQEAGFLSGILLGDKSEVDDDIKSNFKKSNLSHILAISGMHVIYIVSAVEWILNKLIKSKKLKNIILIIFLILFTVFTGSSPSCMRACIMMIVLLISKNVYRKNDFFTTWCFAMIIILLINVYNIENIGMWLSFFGAFALKNINLKSSFAVQVLIFPIIWYSYNTISLTFFISNYLVSFIIGPILIIGYVSLFIGKYFKIIIIIEKILLSLIFGIAQLVGSFSISNIYVATPNISNIFPRNYAEINFLDVGQGDCCFIITQCKKTILIDGGNNKDYDYGENVVLPYILKHGYQSIDYVMISHFDDDHSRRDRIYT